MNKSTIIYMGGFSLPDKSASANRVVSVGKIFNSLGYRTVFLGNAPHSEVFNGVREVKGFEDMYEQSYPQSSAQWVKSLISVRNLCEVVKKYQQVKMIILYNMPVITLLRIKAAFSDSDIRVCYDCTEWSKDTDGSFLKRTFKTLDEYFVRNFAHKIADGMIAISNLMQEKYKGKKPFVKLPPLVDINDKIWHQEPYEKNKFEFLFAGGLDGNKESLDSIVEAFTLSDNKNAILRIIGVTEEEFFDFYKNSNLLSSLDGRVVFMGRLNHAETVRYILTCDSYVFIRQSDLRNNAGFPTKFVEAFTCDAPIITTDVSDVRDYLSQGKGCLVENINIDEIQNALNHQLKAEGSDREIRNDFHFENFKEPLNKWINELI